jgi:hypothetical protein
MGAICGGRGRWRNAGFSSDASAAEGIFGYEQRGAWGSIKAGRGTLRRISLKRCSLPCLNMGCENSQASDSCEVLWKPYKLSWRTNDAKLLCLKYLVHREDKKQDARSILVIATRHMHTATAARA